MHEELVFRLFAPCIPVKGHSRSLICDVFRGRYKYIPNTLFYLLTKFSRNTISEIKSYFENQHNETIEEYFTFLEENEFGFFCDKKELRLFPKLNLDFEQPSIITNAIIDINKSSYHNYSAIFHQLGELGCRHWQLRFYDEFSCNQLREILNQRKDIPVRSIQLILKYAKTSSELIKEVYEDFPISQIDVHSVPAEEMIKLKNEYKKFPIHCHTQEMSNETHCGKISIDNFKPSISLFSESQNHNTCLNQKISIDVKGEIKNCPSMKEGFGSIKKITLLEVVEKPQFKKYWVISKDKILVCKDCEFRHICTDCRAYIEDPKDLRSKPLKCGYDPYTTKWEDWSKNALKQKAIEHYKMKELVVCE